MNSYIYVDTETGGLRPDSHSLLSIGIMVVKDGLVVDAWYRLIRESEMIVAEESALKINGLSIDMVHERGISPIEAIREIEAMLRRHAMPEPCTIAAHKADFDYGFMRRLWRLAGLEPEFDKHFSHRLLCTQASALLLHFAGLIELAEGKASLDNVAAALGIHCPPDRPHNAMFDARIGNEILVELVTRTQRGKNGFGLVFPHIAGVVRDDVVSCGLVAGGVAPAADVGTV